MFKPYRLLLPAALIAGLVAAAPQPAAAYHNSRHQGYSDWQPPGHNYGYHHGQRPNYYNPVVTRPWAHPGWQRCRFVQERRWSHRQHRWVWQRVKVCR